MPASLANDLRSEARSYQRDKDHKAKWANGSVPRSGRRQLGMHVEPTEGPVKPAAVWDHNHGAAKMKKFIKKSNNAQASTLARKAFRNDLHDAYDGPLAHVTDNSSDEEVHDASAAPLPVDADFMYSYDSTSGPAAGRDILSAALNNAVLRFENTETEKLVTREYDVIEQLKDGYAGDEEEDDYEMITEAHLK